MRGESCGDDVLCDVTRHVAGRAVDLGWIFSGERAAAVTAVAAVGVDDDFAASEACITHRAADDEAAGGIDVEFGFAVEHLGGYHWFDHFVENRVGQIALRNFFAVLRGDDGGVNARGAAFDVLDCDLGFAVGSEEINFAGLANIGESLGELMRELDGHGHQLGSFVAGEAEHQALVAGAAGIDAHGDIVGLLLDGADDAAGFGVEAVLGAGVTDVFDDLARQVRKVDVRLGGDFAGDDHQAGGNKRFTGNATHRVVFHDGVEDGVGNLVGNLIGVALGYRLRGKQELLIGMRQNSILPKNGEQMRGRI